VTPTAISPIIQKASIVMVMISYSGTVGIVFRSNCYYCCEEEYSGKAGVSPCSVMVLSLVLAGFLEVGYRNKAYTVLVLPESTEARLGSTLSRRSAPTKRMQQRHGRALPSCGSLLHRLAWSLRAAGGGERGVPGRVCGRGRRLTPLVF
jgi:hypothetical protein